MTLLRRHIALLLVLALALTGQQAAQARGMQTAVGQTVICIGQTVVTVRVDAKGQPVQATHLCPDIALSLFVAEAGGFVAEAPLRVWRDWRAPLAGLSDPRGRAPGAQARGPPRFV